MRSSPFATLDRRLVAAPDAARIAFLRAQDFAHRGLWGGPTPENSLAAARAAITAGFGIECDVRLARDGTAMIFHDADTKRMTARPGTIARMAEHELAALRLGGGQEHIPTLSQLIGLIAGRVPLLIEIKTDTPAQTAPLCLAVRRVLEGYRGPVAVMGFDPAVSHWFAAHAPKIVRGLVMTEHRTTRWRGLRDALARRLAIRRARPDFVAYDVRFLPSSLPSALKAAALPVLSWTVRSDADRAIAMAHADRPIFERLHTA